MYNFYKSYIEFYLTFLKKTYFLSFLKDTVPNLEDGKMKAKIFSTLIIFTIIFSINAIAWENEYHVQMVKDAVALCPKELRTFLKKNIDATINGAIEPDKVISTPSGYAYGYRKHYYIPEGDKGDAPYEVKMISLSVIDLLLEDFPDKGLIAYRMGLVSHYVADTIEPKRYIGVAPNYPVEYLIEESSLTVTYNGYNPIRDYSEDLKDFAAEIWQRDLTDEELYDLAVNFIVDVWTSIWEDSGLPMGESIIIGSMIRPVPPEKGESSISTIFEPSTYFDLEKLGETQVFDERSFDLEKYGQEKSLGSSVDTEGTEEAPLSTESAPEVTTEEGTTDEGETPTNVDETTEEL